ncbi:MAG: hypothetical protein AseanaTS_21000 [Candidatus Pelagadaptatus aseana]|uniref:PA3496 family putative envelope integrity protein n=1 Tax=Candidatus Pelagadaptatus aseana TaxID=3120508 RepID=UPI0039B20440
MEAQKVTQTPSRAKAASKRGPSKVAQQEMEARRRLEEKLEQRRLERELMEFDFE